MKIIPIALCTTAITFAQAVVSPEVHADRSVTFRLAAPKAAEAAFYGDWMAPGTTQKMTKGSEGIWSITVGPLKPSVYIYNFLLDGLAIADPVNPRVKLRARTSASLVEVVGAVPALWDATDVPHGAVEINWQQSKALGGETRWIWVYTPPGYAKDAKLRYPVLYLFHGSNDIAGGWTLVGHVNFILDNLTAQKKAQPMLVVMPFGHAVPFGEAQAANTTLYEEYVLNDVMPYVESKYRIASGREKRAIAGLSMGGGQALHIGFTNMDKFGAIGVFSSGLPADFETRFAAALSDPAGTSAKLQPIWIACGREDAVFARSQKLADLLASRKIRHLWNPTEGNHTYTYWRQYLGEFAPLLFRR